MKNRIIFSAVFTIFSWVFPGIPSNCFTETAKIDSLLRELKNSKQEERFEILHDLGWAYKDIDTEKAMESEHKALDLARSLGDSIRVARSLYHLARIYTNNNYDLAVKYSERSIELLINNNEDPENIIKYYRNLAFIQEKNYQYEAALKSYENAYAYFVNHDEIISTDILKSITEILINMGDYETALEKCEKRLKIWEKHGNDYKIADSYLDLGRIYWFLSEYSKSNISLLYLEAHERNNNVILNNDKVIIYFCLANSYISKGDFYFSLKYFNKIFFTDDFKLTKNILSNSYSLIAFIFYYISDYNSSYYYYLKSLNIFTEINDIVGIGSCLQGLGQVLYKMNKKDLSLNCFNKAKKIFIHTNELMLLSIIYNELGLIYYDSNQYKNATYHFNNSLQLKKEISDKKGIAILNQNLAKLSIKTNEFNVTESYLLESNKLSTKIGDYEIMKENYEVYSNFYEVNSLYKKALIYLNLSENIKDSLFSNERISKIRLMDIELTSLEKQKELDLLESESRIISRELEKEKLLRIKLIMLSYALLLFAVSLILYSRSIKRSNQKLAEEIRIRAQSEAVLLKLKQELELRVKDRTSDLIAINEQLRDTVMKNKRSEKILMETEKKAGIGELAAGIAHEVRNPIAIIKSTAQYLKEIYSETEKIMDNLISNSDEINHVIFQLMEFAKLDLPNPEEVKISTFLKNCLEKFEHEIVQRQIELRMKGPQEDITVNVDPRLYEILIANLISNALEGIPDKGIIGIMLVKKLNCLHLEITDNGNGIEDPEKAFIPFFTTKKNHSGLGLCFVQHIAALHNTRFELKSELSRGTKVKLSIMLN